MQPPLGGRALEAADALSLSGEGREKSDPVREEQEKKSVLFSREPEQWSVLSKPRRKDIDEE